MGSTCEFSTKERLYLASGVLRYGCQNWTMTRKLLRNACSEEYKRDESFYTASFCASEYGKLIDECGLMNRFRRSGKHESIDQVVVRHATSARLKDLVDRINRDEDRVKQLGDILALVDNGTVDRYIEEIQLEMSKDHSLSVKDILMKLINKPKQITKIRAAPSSTTRVLRSGGNTTQTRSGQLKRHDTLSPHKRRVIIRNSYLQCMSEDDENVGVIPELNKGTSRLLARKKFERPALRKNAGVSSEFKGVIAFAQETMDQDVADSRKPTRRNSQKTKDSKPSRPAQSPSLLLESSDTELKSGKPKWSSSGREVTVENVGQKRRFAALPRRSEDDGLRRDGQSDSVSRETSGGTAPKRSKSRSNFNLSVGSNPSSSASNYSYTNEETDSLNKSWRKAMIQILNHIGEHRYAYTFLTPVPTKTPGYHQVIKYPRDIRTIIKEVDGGQIKSFDVVYRDLLVMFQNALMFNRSDTDVYMMTLDMFEDANQKLAQFMDSLEAPRNYMMF